MKEENTEDIARLLALKAYESPDAERMEKNVQNTMRAVRAAHARPSLHLFPDKSMAWMFAQPRYGIAALFILFLGLHMIREPIPRESVGASAVQEPPAIEEYVAVAETNTAPVALPAVPAIPQAVRPNYSSLVKPVSFTQ